MHAYYMYIYYMCGPVLPNLFSTTAHLRGTTQKQVGPTLHLWNSFYIY